MDENDEDRVRKGERVGMGDSGHRLTIFRFNRMNYIINIKRVV